LTRIGTRNRLAASAGRCLRAAYRSVLAARYAGRVSAKSMPGAYRSVLIIRGDGGIGDFVLFLPSLREFRRHYAGTKISLLVGSESAELASTFTDVDEVISFEVRRYRLNLAYRIRLIQRLRNRQLDVALNPMYSREPMTDELLYCSGAKERIVFDGNLDNIDARTKTENNAYCTRIIPSSAGQMHELARNREFVERLTGAPSSTKDSWSRLSLSESLVSDATALLRRRGLDPQRDLIVAMFPGALSAIKMWPADRFAQLADHMAAKYGARILLCGSNSDRERGKRICELTSTPPASVIADTTLPELAAVLHLSALYIGNDSGPLHIAAAVDTPTVCILGGGHFGRFLPYPDSLRHRAVFNRMPCYQCNWRCIHDTVRCIQEISCDAVWSETQRMMDEVVLPVRESRLEESGRPVQ
jgi:ADP-heptose:LPS heptosyltransferase